MYLNEMRVLITGATGMLGARLAPYLASQGCKIFSHGMSKKADYNTDLCDVDQTASMLDELSPDVIIHLVCLSNVDKCEDDQDLAYRLNVLTTDNIVKWAEKHEARLVYISTDQVYDGEGLHKEEQVTIRNTYALSKYCGECIARSANSIILRVNFFGKSLTPGRVSITEWILDALHTGRSGDRRVGEGGG